MQKLLSETLKTDDVKVPLRTQTTTRHRYDEIKKLHRGKVGNHDVSLFRTERTLSWQTVECRVLGEERGGAPEHICPLLPELFVFPSSMTSSLHPVSFIELRLVLRVGVLDRDAA